MRRRRNFFVLKMKAAAVKEGDPSDKSWPSAGAIEVTKLVMRYRATLPPVLQQVSFEVSTPRAHTHILSVVCLYHYKPHGR